MDTLETAIDDDSEKVRNKTTIETGDAIRLERLLVYIE
jgi:hypothetical protein